MVILKWKTLPSCSFTERTAYMQLMVGVVVILMASYFKLIDDYLITIAGDTDLRFLSLEKRCILRASRTPCAR